MEAKNMRSLKVLSAYVVIFLALTVLVAGFKATRIEPQIILKNGIVDRVGENYDESKIGNHYRRYLKLQGDNTMYDSSPYSELIKEIALSKEGDSVSLTFLDKNKDSTFNGAEILTGFKNHTLYPK